MRPVLHTEGRHFVDPLGRVVILRGVSLSGGSKVPPFRAVRDLSDLDPLPRLGMNVIRLLFLWEAYEPIAGVYDEGYLACLQAVARAAWERGMYVIVDFHQDGFSRYASRGSGDGFPCWAISPRGKLSAPDNGARSRCWPLLMASDPTTYRAFDDFYRNTFGVRTRYLEMVARVASAFATIPGVIGYDPLNEPWGDERRDLAALYTDAATAIRSRHPSALMFVEGQVTTNSGVQTKLPRPTYAGAVYAPHYYKTLPLVIGRWFGGRHNIDLAFTRMNAIVQAWQVPLFVSEFGAPAGLGNAGEYVAAIYDRLDACLASGAQWNYTPTWTEAARDGWNAEDFNILCPCGTLRPNFRPRPYPRLTAGVPLRFTFHEARPPLLGARMEFVWAHSPGRGDTEIFAPEFLFPSGTTFLVEPADVLVSYDASRQVLICRSGRPSTVVLTLTGTLPGLGGPAARVR